MDLQEAIKKSIQAYFDGKDVADKDGKYTKSYLDNFHKTVTSPEEATTSEKKVEKELKNAQTGPN